MCLLVCVRVPASVLAHTDTLDTHTHRARYSNTHARPHTRTGETHRGRAWGAGQRPQRAMHHETGERHVLAPACFPLLLYVLLIFPSLFIFVLFCCVLCFVRACTLFSSRSFMWSCPFIHRCWRWWRVCVECLQLSWARLCWPTHSECSFQT